MANNRKAAIKRLKNLVFTPKSEIGKFRENIEKRVSENNIKLIKSSNTLLSSANKYILIEITPANIIPPNMFLILNHLVNVQLSFHYQYQFV